METKLVRSECQQPFSLLRIFDGCDFVSGSCGCKMDRFSRYMLFLPYKAPVEAKLVRDFGQSGPLNRVEPVWLCAAQSPFLLMSIGCI